MKYVVALQSRARRDVDNIYDDWIERLSIDRADRWLAQIRAGIASLEAMPTRCGLAFESADLDEPLRQLLVGRRPHVHRVLFVVRGQRVHVVRVRHGAQAPLRKADINLPSERDDAFEE